MLIIKAKYISNPYLSHGVYSIKYLVVELLINIFKTLLALGAISFIIEQCF